MLEKNQLKPPALVQVDCDGELALSNHYGLERKGNGTDRIFAVLKQFLRIFDRYGIKATLFVCGKDMEDEEKRSIIRAALDAGHELANHTYSHPGAFQPLSRSEKINEIVKTQSLLFEHFGVESHGFRAPNFELDKELVEILTDKGLAYDCSMLPTPFSPVIRAVKTLLTKKKFNISYNHGYLGPCTFALAPRKPYYPSSKTIQRPAIADGNHVKVMEIPVTVSPILKLPIHSSYALAYPRAFSRAITQHTLRWVARKKLPLLYVFHLSDLCETSILRGIEGRLYNNLDSRTSFVNWVCKEIQQQFESMTTIELVRSLNEL